MANQNNKNIALAPVGSSRDEEVMITPNNFEFPYKPYPSQIKFMESLYALVEARQHAIFESPTGTGKSMSIICGILRWLRNHEDRIRENYRNTLTDLQHKVNQVPINWFEAQSTSILAQKEFNKIKKEQCKLELFDKKMHDILNNKKNRKKGQISSLVNQEIRDENKNLTTEHDFFLEDDDIANTAETINEEEREDEFKPTQVFICSRTHSQLAQFVDELKKSPFGTDARIVTLASRQNTCICPSVKKLGNSTAINERCLEMQNSSNSKKVESVKGKGLKRKRVANIGKCEFYNKDLVQDLSELVLCEPQDIEDLVRTGSKMKACPYYASRKASKYAEIILAPYNTVLHKETREANGIDLKGSVLIVDEAHNLLDALCAMNGVTLNEEHINCSIYQLSAYQKYYKNRLGTINMLLMNRTIAALKGMRDLLASATESAVCKTTDFLDKADISHLNLHSLSMQLKQSLLFRKVQGFAKSKPNLVEEMAQSIEAKRLKNKSPFVVRQDKTKTTTGMNSFLLSLNTIQNTSETTKIANVDSIDAEVNQVRATSAPLHAILAFMQAIASNEKSSRILLHSGKTLENDVHFKRSFEYLVLDPSEQFADIVKDCRSVVVAGGTMKPIEEIKQRLFIKAGARREDVKDYTWQHIIPPRNILPVIIDCADSVRRETIRFDFQKRNAMTPVIVKLLRLFGNSKRNSDYNVGGGIVVFFTSYQYMNWVVEQTKNVQYGLMPLFIEPQEAGTVQRILDDYASAIRKDPKCGAMLFCVMGGKLSEGINFKDELGRLIILFGLPFPYQDSVEYKEKLSFIEENEGARAAKEMGLIMCMKTVNQCIGRAIRHKDDYAAVLLVDQRYKRPEVQALLPDWIKNQLIHYNVDVAYNTMTDFYYRKGNEKIVNKFGVS